MLALAPATPGASSTATAAVAAAIHVDDGGGLVDVAVAIAVIGHGGGAGRFVIAPGRWRSFAIRTITSLLLHNATRRRRLTIFTSDSEEGKW